RRHAVAGLLAHHRAAVQGRHHRRLDAGVHPLRRRVRHTRAAGRAAHADDRPRAVGRVLQQQRLDHGLHRRRRAGAADRRAAGHLQQVPGRIAGAAVMSAPKATPAQWFGRAWLAGGFLFLYLPIVTLVIYSFNASSLPTVWGGFTLDWYAKLANDREMLAGLWLSLKIAFLSACGSVLLGTLAAFSLVKYRRFTGRTLFNGLVNAPLVMPEVICGLSLLLMLVSVQKAIGFPERGLMTIW